jgi:dihydrofolate synthase / folylpolyglutamate synthase
MNSYERTLAWLYGLEAARGMDFKLERIALALERLGRPHRSYPVLHVAGTNGKGSVAAMLHSVLQRTDRRVGLYVSPHLVDFRERIRVGEEWIEVAAVVDLAEEVRRAASGIDLTFFEMVTVMAFLYFARSRVDIAVIEVGLGGRLDATNVVDPLASVITTIGLDHTQYLGKTIEAIAAEKGGIIKAQRPLIVGRMPQAALRTLDAIALQRGAPMYELERHYRVGGGESLCFRGLGCELDGLRLGLAGPFQRDNAAVALAALAVIRDSLPVPEPAIRAGLTEVHWPGRFEVIKGIPDIVLDGAHNPDGIDALRKAMEKRYGGRRVHLLFAVMADKDWPAMVERLAPLCSSAVVTEVLPPRGQAGALVAATFRRWCPAVAEPDIGKAWSLVRSGGTGEETILVAGSLFLVGAVKSLLRAGTDASAGLADPIAP